MSHVYFALKAHGIYHFKYSGWQERNVKLETLQDDNKLLHKKYTEHKEPFATTTHFRACVSNIVIILDCSFSVLLHVKLSHP